MARTFAAPSAGLPGGAGGPGRAGRLPGSSCAHAAPARRASATTAYAARLMVHLHPAGAATDTFDPIGMRRTRAPVRPAFGTRRGLMKQRAGTPVPTRSFPSSSFPGRLGALFPGPPAVQPFAAPPVWLVSILSGQ